MYVMILLSYYFSIVNYILQLLDYRNYVNSIKI